MNGTDPVKLAGSWMVTIGVGMAALGGGITYLALELVASKPTIWQVEFQLVGATTAQQILSFGLLSLLLGVAAILLGTLLFVRQEWLTTSRL